MNIKDKFKALFNKKLIPEVPANGGNINAMKTLIETREQDLDYWLKINNNRVDNVLNNLANNTLYSYNFWYLLQFMADYFVNNVEWYIEDQLLFNAISMVFRGHFIYGNVGLYKKGDSYIPVALGETKANVDGSINYCEAYYLIDMLTNQVMTIESTLQERKIDIYDIENLITLKTNSSGLFGLIKWRPFISQQEDILKKIYNASIIINKKVVYNCNDEMAAKRDLELLYSNNSPFIINKDTISPTSNIFNTETTIDNVTGEMFDYYFNFIKIYYSMLGRKMNLDTKKERNIKNEVEASQANLEILEREDYINKELFLKAIKKQFGLNIEVVEWKQKVKDSESKDKENDIEGLNRNQQ